MQLPAFCNVCTNVLDVKVPFEIVSRQLKPVLLLDQHGNEVKVYMTDFFICSIKSPQCTDIYSNEKLSIAICDVPKGSNFTSGGVQNHEIKNRNLGMIVTSF